MDFMGPVTEPEPATRPQSWRVVVERSEVPLAVEAAGIVGESVAGPAEQLGDRVGIALPLRAALVEILRPRA